MKSSKFFVLKVLLIILSKDPFYQHILYMIHVMACINKKMHTLVSSSLYIVYSIT